jgi:hypothetical protein
MRIYSVYLPAGGDEKTRLEKAVLVKEGFSWPALFFSWVFLAFTRMWIVLGLYSVLLAAAAMLCALLKAPSQITFLVFAGLALVLAFEANALRGWTLSRRGYTFQGVVTGANLMQAEEKLFEDMKFDIPDSNPAGEPTLCESPS